MQEVRFGMAGLGIGARQERKEIYLEYQSPSSVMMPEPLKKGGSPDRYAHNIWR